MIQIQNYTNSLGSCFPYDSYKSLKWNSHAQYQELCNAQLMEINLYQSYKEIGIDIIIQIILFYNQYQASHYQNSCIQLKQYFKHMYKQCHINHKGIVRDVKGEILSIGLFIWDSITFTNIISTTYLECQSRLTYCTTNCKQCFLKVSCTSYFSEEICENAEGFDHRQNLCLG
ncbi:unnamed protein product [Paramecium pentaurelia]|uniref:Uncharacterized protein n=1 Tax=Paramecium pentaurelia TaxID=43138 RepID=A0A8S1XUY6_9CILI|nr:unnamed protein product [Paramecium pentaurelia]